MKLSSVIPLLCCLSAASASLHNHCKVLRAAESTGFVSWSIRDSAVLSPLTRAGRCDCHGARKPPTHGTILAQFGGKTWGETASDNGFERRRRSFQETDALLQSFKARLKAAREGRSYSEELINERWDEVLGADVPRELKLRMWKDKAEAKRKEVKWIPEDTIERIMQEQREHLREAGLESEFSPQGAKTFVKDSAARISQPAHVPHHVQSPEGLKTSSRATNSKPTVESRPVEAPLPSSEPVDGPKSVKTKRGNERTGMALCLQARSGKADGVRVLLEMGADVNGLGNRRRTALHEAVVHGHVDIVRMLLVAGANMDCCDEDGVSPAHEAVKSGRLDILGLMKERA